LILFFLNITTK